MAKKKKLTKEELENVQGAVNLVNQITTEIGRLESSKLKLYSNLQQAENKLAEERKTLEDKYGSVTIDLNTGEMKDME